MVDDWRCDLATMKSIGSPLEAGGATRNLAGRAEVTANSACVSRCWWPSEFRVDAEVWRVYINNIIFLHKDLNLCCMKCCVLTYVVHKVIDLDIFCVYIYYTCIMIVPKIWKTQSLGSPGEKYSHLPKSWMYECLRKMEPVIEGSLEV